MKEEKANKTPIEELVRALEGRTIDEAKIVNGCLILDTHKGEGTEIVYGHHSYKIIEEIPHWIYLIWMAGDQVNIDEAVSYPASGLSPEKRYAVIVMEETEAKKLETVWKGV